MDALTRGELSRVQSIRDFHVDVDESDPGRRRTDWGSVACLCLVLSLFIMVFGVAMMSLAYSLKKSTEHVSLLDSYGFRMDTVGLGLFLVGLFALFVGFGLVSSGACQMDQQRV